jgi:2-methylcitrate dehydratase PrpD
MSKIKYSFLQDLGHGLNLPQEVMVKLKNGSEYTCRVEKVKGSVGNPLSDNELTSKFRDCASSILNSKETNKVLELLYHLEDLENITGLMKLIGMVGSV